MLNEALKRIRQSNGASLTETARQLGVSKSHLSEIENHKKSPSLDFLKRFSSHFGIPLSYILFFSENYDEKEGKFSKITREYLGKLIVSQIR